MLAIFVFVALLGGAAFAQTSSKDVEKDLDHDRSGVITIEQLGKLQTFTIKVADIAVFFVLPQGWELEEPTVDRTTGKQLDKVNVYVVYSNSVGHEDQKVPDLIFELTVFLKGLDEDLPPDIPEEQRSVGYQFRRFLNEQISYNLKGGLDLKTPLSAIDAKPYGTSSKRAPTLFVPLKFEVPQGGELYTFSSFTGNKAWQIRFYVEENQIENYGALIALILDNAFGLTKDEFEAMTGKDYNEQ